MEVVLDNEPSTYVATTANSRLAPVVTTGYVTASTSALTPYTVSDVGTTHVMPNLEDRLAEAPRGATYIPITTSSLLTLRRRTSGYVIGVAASFRPSEAAPTRGRRVARSLRYGCVGTSQTSDKGSTAKSIARC